MSRVSNLIRKIVGTIHLYFMFVFPLFVYFHIKGFWGFGARASPPCLQRIESRLCRLPPRRRGQRPVRVHVAPKLRLVRGVLQGRAAVGESGLGAAEEPARAPDP